MFHKTFPGGEQVKALNTSIFVYAPPPGYKVYHYENITEKTRVIKAYAILKSNINGRTIRGKDRYITKNKKAGDYEMVLLLKKLLLQFIKW